MDTKTSEIYLPLGRLRETETKAATLIGIKSLVKRFGAVQVLRDVSLDISEGEFLTILGESGSGKTTLLRLIAGFEQPDAGEIWMEGERLDLLPPYRRRVNTVFQNYALFPHLSVFENVAYGLRVRGVSKAEIPARVEEALKMVKMQTLAHARPGKISGGQQQRVALARALINQPRVLLLDEPLSALDANLRREMQRELKSLQREVGISFLFVTHDQEEAMTLSDRIALLHAGRLEQIATPREIYQQPASSYVAQFVGQTNLLRCLVADGMARSGTLAWRCAEGDGSATFSLRPESITLAVDPALPSEGDMVRFRAKVNHQSFHGATDLLQVTCTDGQVLLVRIPSCENLSGAHDFEFSASHAIRVQDEPQEG